MDYENKHILAPMVRVGTLPFRLLAAQYGADITYGEEIIDHKMVKCERRSNDSLGTTDFVETGTENVVFRTCRDERNRVVFQMGTSDAVRALTAAQIVCKDVAAIDINMGCPKAFSTSGGMGSALLSKPELIHDILTTLRRNLNIAVTCKIRLLSSPRDTVELAQRIERTGVSALAVHGRRIKDRPRDPAKWSEIADIVASLSIPVIANGDVFEYEDFERIKCATGATSVMVARGALWNASIFSSEGKSSWENVKREYVRKSILWDNDIKSTKHTLKEMIMHYSCLEFAEGKAVIRSESAADLAKIYGEQEYYRIATVNMPRPKSKLARTENGRRVCDTVLSSGFWSGVGDCLDASPPLLQVLRIVDGDERPALAEVVSAIVYAKVQINKIFGSGKLAIRNKVVKIIEDR